MHNKTMFFAFLPIKISFLLQTWWWRREQCQSQCSSQVGAIVQLCVMYVCICIHMLCYPVYCTILCTMYSLSLLLSLLCCRTVTVRCSIISTSNLNKCVFCNCSVEHAVLCNEHLVTLFALFCSPTLVQFSLSSVY